MNEFRANLAALRKFAQAHPLDVLKLQTPLPEHYREFKCRGHKYRICFTYQVTGDIEGYILSVYDVENPTQKPDMRVSRYIADAIFPGGNYMDGDALNINVLHISRKYISFEALNERAKNI